VRKAQHHLTPLTPFSPNSYIENPEEREEGGTPNILGIIRCGMVFQLQAAVGYSAIEAREKQITDKMLKDLTSIPHLKLLGPATNSTPRLPIFSFLIQHPTSGRYLHWSFVAAVLNDLFGIQCRGG